MRLQQCFTSLDAEWISTRYSTPKLRTDFNVTLQPIDPHKSDYNNPHWAFSFVADEWLEEAKTQQMFLQSIIRSTTCPINHGRNVTRWCYHSRCLSNLELHRLLLRFFYTAGVQYEKVVPLNTMFAFSSKDMKPSICMCLWCAIDR